MKMCVAVPTDDGKLVKIGHFGDGKYYYHYVYENGRWKLVEVVENPYVGEHSIDEEDEESSKRPKIFEMNSNCTHIVATAFGPGGSEYMEKRGLKVIKVKPKTRIEEALNLIREQEGLT